MSGIGGAGAAREGVVLARVPLGAGAPGGLVGDRSGLRLLSPWDMIVADHEVGSVRGRFKDNSQSTAEALDDYVKTWPAEKRTGVRGLVVRGLLVNGQDATVWRLSHRKDWGEPVRLAVAAVGTAEQKATLGDL